MSSGAAIFVKMKVDNYRINVAVIIKMKRKITICNLEERFQ